MNEQELVLEIKRLEKLLEELENESMQEDISNLKAMYLDIEIGIVGDAIASYATDLYKIMY